MKRLGWITFAAFVLTVWAANYAIGHIGTEAFPGGPHTIPVWPGLAAPSGVLFAGLAFTFRDLIQRTLGRHAVVLAILAGGALSWHLGGAVARASCIAFLASELADFAVYTPLERRGWLKAVFASNVVGLVVDSYLFLTIAFGSTAFIGGQIVGKLWATGAAVAVLAVTRGRFAPAHR